MTDALPHDLHAFIQTAGSAGQLLTAGIAVLIAVATFRHQRQQSRRALINESNALANLVNATLVAQPAACAVLGRLQTPIVGCPDDAVLFMYLNWVHNTWRNRQAGAVGEQVWQDTLAGCTGTLLRLRRDQVARLLARGYEAGFQAAVLARHDAAKAAGPALVEPLRQAA